MQPLVIILTAFLLAACNNPSANTPAANERELLPEPEKAQREQYEAEQHVVTNGCVFLNPDTSLAGIQLRDAQSAAQVINSQDKMNDNGEYHFYSGMYRETLTMTQHPGDGKYQVSIFKVAYSDKADYGYRELSIDTFKTEKGIRLGLNKKQIIDKLGPCYITKDSTEAYIELYYRLEVPNDSKTRLLLHHNMPIYYASYKLCKDRLEAFEFGFEYP